MHSRKADVFAKNLSLESAMMIHGFQQMLHIVDRIRIHMLRQTTAEHLFQNRDKIPIDDFKIVSIVRNDILRIGQKVSDGIFLC